MFFIIFLMLLYGILLNFILYKCIYKNDKKNGYYLIAFKL